MHQPRYNIYTTIHKALRFSMCETLTALGRVDDRDEKALLLALEATERLLQHCRNHLAHEDQFIHPLLGKLCGGESFTTADDHAQHELEIDELQVQIDEIKTASVQQRALLVLHFYREFSLFVAENLIHMRNEEIDNNQVLWANFTDSQIQVIEQAIVDSIPPEENMETLLVMLPNITHRERVELLSGMQQGAPTEVFAFLLSQLKPKLFVADWIKLTTALHLTNETSDVL
jgi:hypothetical protein